ncbi:rhodanese-like domain-containing protein [Pseudodesulfovibrio sp.]|uniref:rhodanese-like domain-containing protein n=1 Tax=unclassified Pseudodesulfovibrio TaxID=2661612 RepID=UPI003AFFB419
MIRRLFSCLLLAACAVLASAPASAEGFPLRAYYPEVTPITTDELIRIYDQALILDIRSRFEFGVAKINKAVLLPLTDEHFAAKLERLRAKDSTTPMVFYCNGHTCAKSYQAAQLALSLGFGHVYVYDAGIFDWISHAPAQATLMGETPARVGRIISPEAFRQRQVDYARFKTLAQEPDTIVIDIRDPFQRALIPRLNGIRNIPLDPLLDLVISRIWTEKRLLFFDAVGKQVRWLQYFLESYGYFEYAFLKGGVRAIADDPNKIQPVIETNRSIVSSQEMLLTITADSRLDNTDRKVLSYLLANVKFNNYIVVETAAAERDMGLSHPLFMAAITKLDKLGYMKHAITQDNIVIQVDPRLAWKGDMDGPAWKEKLADFGAAATKGKK